MSKTRAEDMPASTPEERIAKALAIAMQSGGVDGAHHKTWVIDQMVRALTTDYAAFVREHNRPEGGDEDEYSWDEGIAP